MFRTFTAICALALASNALASPVYNFTDNNANTGPANQPDLLDSLSVTWDAGTEKLNFSSTFTTTDVDSFWLVINDGPNPKQVDTNELVIMYGDLVSGRVYSYVYNGDNNANSYNTPGIFLQSDALNVVGSSINFEIDATDINNAIVPLGSGIGAEAYRGIVAGPGFGIWYHVAKNSTFVANAIDGISNYAPGTQGWYDRGGLTMERVPEPGSVVLLGLGLVGLGALRRRRQAS